MAAPLPDDFEADTWLPLLISRLQLPLWRMKKMLAMRKWKGARASAQKGATQDD